MPGPGNARRARLFRSCVSFAFPPPAHSAALPPQTDYDPIPPTSFDYLITVAHYIRCIFTLSNITSFPSIPLTNSMIYHGLALALATLPTTFAATWDVSVGANAMLRYDPQTIPTAAVGDIVNFVFHPKNHTVTQSSFAAPCVPLAGGSNSGFMPVAAEGTGLPTFQITVKDTNPIWIHCEQTGHCAKGMVFAVNPPPDSSPNSFAAFQALANGTANATATTTSPASSSTDYVTPPPPSVVTVTATVTLGASTWTTTYGSYDGTPPPTPAAQPVDHKITVGDNGQLVYNPANISAAIGDTVTFEFHPKNHTVTQSSFLKPCQPLADTSVTHQVGFSSGFNPVDANTTTFPTFQIKINDTAPIWGYCGQKGHCGSGMVFAINAVESGPNNFAAFQTLAERINGTSANATGSSTAPASTSTKSGATSFSYNTAMLSFTSAMILVVVSFF